MALLIEDEEVESRVRRLSERTGLSHEEVVWVALYVYLQRRLRDAPATSSERHAERELAQQVARIESRLGRNAAELLLSDEKAPETRGSARGGND